MATFIPKKLIHLKDRLASLLSVSAITGVAGDNVQDVLSELSTSASRVSITLADVPRHVWWVFGDSSDGGTTPNTATQESIDALLAAGVPSANIRWLYESEGNNFVIADISSTPTIEEIVLTQAGGTFSIANLTSTPTIDGITLELNGGDFVITDISSTPTIENIVLVNADTLEFVIADLSSTPTIEEIVLELAGGEFAMAGLSSTPTIENIVLTLAGGTFSIADLSSTATIDNIVLEEAAGGVSLPINESFGTNLGVFSTKTGTPTVSGGNLVLDGGESVDVDVSFSRDVRLTANINLVDTLSINEGSIVNFVFQSEASPLDAYIIQALVSGEDDGEGGVDPTFFLLVQKIVDGTLSQIGTEYARAVDDNAIQLIAEVQAGGNIIIKEDGTIRVTVADSTYTNFDRFEIANVPGGITSNVLDVLLEAI